MKLYEEKDIQLIKNAAEFAGLFSTCLSRKIGAIITNENKISLCFGYNHPEHYKSCSERNPNKEEMCPRQKMGFKSGFGMVMCDAVHAEVDVIRQLKKYESQESQEIRLIPDYETLFLYASCPIPCIGCSSEIVSFGLFSKIYCIKVRYIKNEYYFQKSKELLLNEGIEIIEIPKEEIFM